MKSPQHRLFADKVVVVTGASAGVGRATAIEFAKGGAKVAIFARGQEGLDSAAREIELAGGRAFARSVDMADATAVANAAAAVEETLGPIDIWVNNAMVTIFAPVKLISPDEFKRVTEVTYLGNVNGTMAALKRMLKRNRGVIVQVSSALAYRSIPLQSAYCGAKHAITGFTDSLRSELEHDRSKVRVTAVQLAAMNTPQFGWARNRMPCKPQPVPPIFQPEVAARAIVWASCHTRREVAVGAPTLLAEWAQKIAPGLVDRYLARTGYRGQQLLDEPDNHERPDNLFEPVAGDPGTHGRFDARAQAHSPAVWVVEQRNWLVLAGLGLGTLLWAGTRRARRGHWH
jgi:NAD(P)-dependent dehydrogenase (short-subunit alcohol dehydrogenase family)